MFTLLLTSLLASCASGAAGNSSVEPERCPATLNSTIDNGEPVAELDKAIWHVFQARNGDFWFGSPEKGAYRYDGRTLVRFTDADGLGANHISGFQEDKSGNLYISAGDRISRFDGRSFTALSVSTASDPNDWQLNPDDMWFGGPGDTGTVYRFDGKSLHRLAIPETEAGRRHNAAHPRSLYPNIHYSPYDPFTIFKDSKDNIWFGTAILGACRYDGRTFAWIPEEDLRNGSFGTRSIVEDKDGRFWCSNCVHRYEVDLSDAARPRIVRLEGLRDRSKEDGLPFGGVMSAVKDANGAVWFATYGEGVWRYDGQRLTHFPVTVGGHGITLFSIHLDRQGVAWLGTQENGAFQFNGTKFEQFRP